MANGPPTSTIRINSIASLSSRHFQNYQHEKIHSNERGEANLDEMTFEVDLSASDIYSQNMYQHSMNFHEVNKRY